MRDSCWTMIGPSFCCHYGKLTKAVASCNFQPHFGTEVAGRIIEKRSIDNFIIPCKSLEGVWDVEG